MIRRFFFWALVLGFTFVSTNLFAHHGVANYDTTALLSVKGTVTEVQFVNPHVQISMDVKNEKGEIEKWKGEAQSPAMLVRYSGWNRNTIKAGDTITASGHRTKNGLNFLRLVKITLSDGKELTGL